MKATLIVIFSLLICGTPAAIAQEIEGEEQVLYIPQFGHGADQGLHFETTVNILNLSDVTARAEIRTFDDDGNPIGLLLRKGSPLQPGDSAVAAVGEELGAFGFAEVRSLSSTPSQLGIGWAQVIATPSVAVEVVFSSRNADGRLLTSTSVLPVPASDAFSLIAQSDPTARTGLALLNPPDSGGSANVTLQLFDAEGAQVGENSIALSPGEKVARFIDESEFFPELAGGEFVGSIEVRSDRDVVAMTLRIEGIFLTTQLVLPAREAPGSAQTTYVAQFGHGRDAGLGLDFDTSVNILNLSSAATDIQVSSFDDAGNPINLLNDGQGEPAAISNTTLQLSGFGLSTLQSLSETPDQVSVGWVEVASEVPVAVEVVFSSRNSAGQILTSTSVLPVTPTQEFSFIAFADSTARTGIALLNPSGTQSADITLQLFDRFGEPAGETTLSLAPGQKIARIIDESELFPELMGTTFSGSVEVRSSVSILPMTLRIEGIHLTTQLIHPSREGQ